MAAELRLLVDRVAPDRFDLVFAPLERPALERFAFERLLLERLALELERFAFVAFERRLLVRLALDLPEPRDRFALGADCRLAGFADFLLEGRRLSALAAALVSAVAAVVDATDTGAAASRSAVAAPNAAHERKRRAGEAVAACALILVLMIHPRFVACSRCEQRIDCSAGRWMPPAPGIGSDERAQT